VSEGPVGAGGVVSPRRLLAPLALAQFICSFAGSNMNVMINDITEDLDTSVAGVQATITLFLLTMAILMIPCSKLTDRWGRKRCFVWGLTLYGVGALLSAAAPGLGVLILGNSILEGVGTALLIPPVYILTTLAFSDLTSRAKAFGAISGMGGIGAAAGPLIGGVITSAISWRAAFVFQARHARRAGAGRSARSSAAPRAPFRRAGRARRWPPERCCRASVSPLT
jgi:MFS family permease